MKPPLQRSALLDWTLRVLVAAGLIVDAVVHLRLAGEYQFAFPEGIGGGNLFRIEAAVAVIAAIFVVVRGSRVSYVAAFLVAFSALVAVVLTRYVELPAIGPIPSMYEPIWFPEKTLSAIAEGAAAAAAAVGVIRTSRATTTSSARVPVGRRSSG